MSDSMDRSAGIGFRCVADEPCPGPGPGPGVCPCAFELCGASSDVEDEFIDLTAAGGVDWAHFGRATAATITRKDGDHEKEQ